MITKNQFLKLFREKYGSVQDKQLLFNFLREELQYLILEAIFQSFPERIYFMGGTCLRLSHRIKRFSEDLDFALDKPNPDFPTRDLAARLQTFFSEKTTGFQVECTASTRRTVQKLFLKFSNLLAAAGLSPMAGEKIHIKIEIDVNPPDGATTTRTRYESLSSVYYINAYDLATSFAGKIAAVLMREYAKGRDYYDLRWYLENAPETPFNLAYLNSALNQQKATQGPIQNVSGLQHVLEEKITTLPPGALTSDLGRFVQMDPAAFEEWTRTYQKETVALLARYMKAHEA